MKAGANLHRETRRRPHRAPRTGVSSDQPHDSDPGLRLRIHEREERHAACKSASGTRAPVACPHAARCRRALECKASSRGRGHDRRCSSGRDRCRFSLEVFEAKRRQALTAAKATTVPAHAAARRCGDCNWIGETVRVSSGSQRNEHLVFAEQGSCGAVMDALLTSAPSNRARAPKPKPR